MQPRSRTPILRDIVKCWHRKKESRSIEDIKRFYNRHIHIHCSNVDTASVDAGSETCWTKSENEMNWAKKEMKMKHPPLIRRMKKICTHMCLFEKKPVNNCANGKSKGNEIKDKTANHPWKGNDTYRRK